MKPAVILRLLVAFILVSTPVYGKPLDFHPESYGAVADDGVDDRAAIQQALDAAAATGGTVSLGPGVYHVLVVAARGYGPVEGIFDGPWGYHGLLIPQGCTLTGAGRDLTTVRLLAGNGLVNTIGDGIINAGYQTAVVDFGAAGGIRIQDLSIDTPDVTKAPTGNLIGLAHADGVVISNVAFGSSRAHALEINTSRNVVVEDCRFDGEHPGASTLQLDYGLVGAKSLVPRGTVIQDILVRRCGFSGRGAETLTAKVIELGHTSSACILRNIAFEDCLIEGLSQRDSTCVSFDNPPVQELTGLRFERCRLTGIQQAPSVSGLITLIHGGSQILSDITIRDCHFGGTCSQGLAINSIYPEFNTGHDGRRNILIEGNTFAPVLNRESPYSSPGFFSLCSAVACHDIIVRRNLFELPATAANLTLAKGVTALQVANCLDARLEDNVFTWAHDSAATAPLPPAKLTGISAPVHLLELNGQKAQLRITGNSFLYPLNGIGSAISMVTGINTTAWAPGGPWVDGLIAGNFAAGAGEVSPWQIHYDLSGARNIGEILPEDASRTPLTGWYPCSGAALTSLDSGKNQLPRVNANKCGYATHLPLIPGKVVRLTGPMRGEGLLADHLSRYAGSVYRGTRASDSDLADLLPSERLPGSIWAVRQPLAVYCWETDPPSGGDGPVFPRDVSEAEQGNWLPLGSGLSGLADDADPDHDGLSNLWERAFLRDPFTAESAEVGEMSRLPDGSCALRFRCASGPHCPRICILASDDLGTWTVESSCPAGGAFPPPVESTLAETLSRNGREVTLTPIAASRKFWKIVVEP